MGVSSSSPRSKRSARVETPPADLPHLSEHLRVMYDSNSRGDSPSRSVRNIQPPEQQPYDIVLFHGLQIEEWQQAWWRTWSVGGSEDPKDWWPKWLAAEDQLGNQLNRIISVSWDSSAKDSKKITEFPLQVASLSNELSGKLERQPFFLIGHSLGGLVIKQLICYLHQKLEPSSTCPVADAAAAAKFLAMLKGVAFYGVPHTGAQLAETARWFPGITKLVTDVLRPNSILTKGLVEKFDVFLAETKLPVLAVLEDRKTHLARGITRTVVPQKVAVKHVSAICVAVNADHYDVCRPKSVLDPHFTQLVSVIRTSMVTNTIDQVAEKLNILERESIPSCILHPTEAPVSSMGSVAQPANPPEPSDTVKEQPLKRSTSPTSPLDERQSSEGSSSSPSMHGSPSQQENGGGLTVDDGTAADATGKEYIPKTAFNPPDDSTAQPSLPPKAEPGNSPRGRPITDTSSPTSSSSIDSIIGTMSSWVSSSSEENPNLVLRQLDDRLNSRQDRTRADLVPMLHRIRLWHELRIKSFDEILAEVEIAIQVDPTCADAVLQRAHFRMWRNKAGEKPSIWSAGKKSDLASAIDDYEAIPDLQFLGTTEDASKKLADSYTSYAHALCKLGNIQDALEAVDDALKHKMTGHILWTHAMILMQAGKHMDALTVLNEAVDLDKDRVPVWYQERGVFKKLIANDMRGALHDLNEANKLLKYDYEVLKHRGHVLWILDRKQEAMEDFDAARQLQSNSCVNFVYSAFIQLLGHQPVYTDLVHLP